MTISHTALDSSGFAARLVHNHLLSQAQVEQAYREARAHRQSLVRYVVSAAYPNSGQIVVAAATECGVPLLNLDAVDRAKLPLNLVDEKLVRKHRALPIFRRGKRLFLAVSDPTDY